jgi:hypothetical protein
MVYDLFDVLLHLICHNFIKNFCIYIVWCCPLLLITESYRKLLPIPVCSCVFHTLSCSCFKVSGLILRSLIHFELILAQDERKGSNFNLLHAHIQFSQHHLVKTLFAPVYILGSFVNSHLTVAVWIYVWSFLFHWSWRLFLCQYHPRRFL